MRTSDGVPVFSSRDMNRSSRSSVSLSCCSSLQASHSSMKSSSSMRPASCARIRRCCPGSLSPLTSTNTAWMGASPAWRDMYSPVSLRSTADLHRTITNSETSTSGKRACNSADPCDTGVPPIFTPRVMSSAICSAVAGTRWASKPDAW